MGTFQSSPAGTTDSPAAAAAYPAPRLAPELHARTHAQACGDAWAHIRCGTPLGRGAALLACETNDPNRSAGGIDEGHAEHGVRVIAVDVALAGAVVGSRIAEVEDEVHHGADGRRTRLLEQLVGGLLAYFIAVSLAFAGLFIAVPGDLQRNGENVTDFVTTFYISLVRFTDLALCF